MQEPDRMSFTLLMGEMCAAFQVEPTCELLAVYWKHLSHFDFKQFEKMVDHSIKTCDRFPTISQILREPEYTYSNDYDPNKVSPQLRARLAQLND